MQEIQNKCINSNKEILLLNVITTFTLEKCALIVKENIECSSIFFTNGVDDCICIKSGSSCIPFSNSDYTIYDIPSKGKFNVYFHNKYGHQIKN